MMEIEFEVSLGRVPLNLRQNVREVNQMCIAFCEASTRLTTVY